MSSQKWFLYIIETDDNRLYTGVTTDVSRRLSQHRGERAGGARFFRGRRAVAVRFRCALPDRSSAQRLEYAVKRLKKHQKEELITGRIQAKSLL
ncbi:MAG: GIY-YIG nuclease family protein [Fibrobacterota bacterium]